MDGEIRIVITLKAEGMDLGVDDVDVVELDGEMRTGSGRSTQMSSVVRLIDDVAPPRLAEFERRYIERAVTELNLEPRLPDSHKRRNEYVNLFPPIKYGAGRASAFAFKSGRVEIYCKPENAEGFAHAETVFHNGVPTWVRVYLTSEDAVEDAIRLTALGLQYR